VARPFKDKGVRIESWDVDSLNTSAMKSLRQGTLAVPCSISDQAELQAACETTCGALGPPSILVNSAGIAGLNAPLASYDIAAWRQVIEFNVHGTFLVNRIVVPGMVAQNHGRILNVAFACWQGRESECLGPVTSPGRWRLSGPKPQYLRTCEVPAGQLGPCSRG